jgi:hypothetical protein
MADVKATTTPKNELKALIKGSSPSKPFQCGVALDPKNRQLAFLLVHRSSAGRQLAAQLKSVPGVNLATFGHVMMGTHSEHPQAVKDAACAVFQLEKPLPGLSKRLKATLKGTGFKKVQIVYDSGAIESDLVEEPGFDEEPDDAGAIQGDETRQAVEESVPPPPPPPPPLASNVPDAASLKRRLGGFLEKVKAANVGPDGTRQMVGLANEANAHIGKNELAQAAALIDEVEASLRLATASPTEAQRAAAPVSSYAKSRLIWIAARKKVQSDLDKLRAAIVARYKDDPDLAEIETRYTSTVAPVLEKLNEELVDKLDDVTNASDTGMRASHVSEARKLIEDYQNYVTTTELIADLDENPFEPLAIRETIVQTLKGLSAAVK